MSDTLLAASGADPRIGMLLQDKYKIVKKLGEGGMGAVYEGEHTLIRRRVAIKCLHAHYANSPEIVARFHREALAATSIGHPNIIECTDMGRFPDGAFFMVLEFLDGRDWSHVLQAHGPQPVGRVVHIMSQVCDALQAAHDKGVVHRDLKPENIFLIKRGADPDFVKVLDFGISKIKGNEGDVAAGPSKSLTRTGMAMGTPYYMAPEQAQGKRDIDHRADIYALGVILFQALTGQYPFDDESYPMLVVKICTQDPPPIEQYRPDLPPGLVHLVNRMLAKSPNDRPQTCADVKALITPYAGQNAAPVVAHDAPPTANAPTFDGQGASTGPFATGRAQTPATRAGVAPTPFAASDNGELSRASLSEIDGNRKSRMGLWIGLGGGGVAIAALAVVAVVLLGGGGTQAPTPTTTIAQPPTPTPVPTPTPTPPPAETGTAVAPTPAQPTVQVQIRTVPPGAQLFLNDAPISNPFDADLPQSTVPRTLRAQRDGYVTYVQDLVLGEFPQRVVIEMQRGRGVQDTSTRGRTARATQGTGGGGHSTPPAVTGGGERQATGGGSSGGGSTGGGSPGTTGTAETPRVETPVVRVETPTPREDPPSGGGGGVATPEATGGSTGSGGCPGGLLDPFGRCRRR